MSGSKVDINTEMADVPPPPPPTTPNSPLTFPSSPLLPLRRGVSEGSSSSAERGYDAGAGGSSSGALLSPPLLVEIEEGTPAAEALRANADVRVSKLLKVGRSTRLQAGVRVLKSAARTASGQPGHAGDRRGAPAFVVPSAGSSSNLSPPAIPSIPEADDEGDSDTNNGKVGWQKSMDDVAEGASLSSVDGSRTTANHGGEIIDDSSVIDGSINLEIDWSSQPQHGTPSTPLTAPSTTAESILHQNYPAKRKQLVTHAALPAAVAAACRAGEEMDRKRASTKMVLERSNSEHSKEVETGKSPKSPFAKMSPRSMSHRRASSSGLVVTGTDLGLNWSGPDNNNNNNNNMSHRRATSSGPGTDTNELCSTPPISVFRRSLREPLQMPSEISVAETERHANLRQPGEEQQIIDDISDDGEMLSAADASSTPNVQTKKHVQVDPIVVEIPGSSRSVIPIDGTMEEDEKRISPDEEDGNREASMARAKKKRSRRSTTKRHKEGVDEDAFHFHGPKSVRKWVKRQRSIERSKNKRSYVKGKVIDGKHELYTMSIAVMFGMRTSIGRTNLAMSQTAHNERRWLDNDDLMAVEKYEFPPRVSLPP